MQKLSKIIFILSILVCGVAIIYSFSVPISESISLNYDTYEMHLDDSITLEATLTPHHSVNKFISWISSNDSVASVNHEGRVIARNYGTTIITAETSNGKTDTCTIQVTPRPVQSVTLSVDYTTIELNYTEKITATVAPANAADTSVVWSSSAQDIVSVDQEGNISALALGNATITATAHNGKAHSITIRVVSEVEVSSISFENTNYTLYYPKTKSIIHTITPGNATNQTLTWISSNPEVATVSATGVVTAKGAGTTTITATASNGTTQSCTIIVPRVKAASFYLENSATTVKISVDGTHQLTYSCISEKGFSYSVTDKVSWSSSKTDIATVDENGIVTAHATGTTLITATLSGITRTVLIEVS